MSSVLSERELHLSVHPVAAGHHPGAWQWPIRSRSRGSRDISTSRGSPSGESWTRSSSPTCRDCTPRGGGLPAFVDHVVPVLQGRGLFRGEHRGATLREHKRLPIPDVAARRPLAQAL
ncbi:MAG TPA: hypothetical protein VHC18_27585 [Amycolatopsis sp.]|nr:hypothetical protein [Amycolatopsis sp.]